MTNETGFAGHILSTRRSPCQNSGWAIRPSPVHYTEQQLCESGVYEGAWQGRPRDLAEAALKEALVFFHCDIIQPPPEGLPGIPSGFSPDENAMEILDLGIRYLRALAHRQPRLQYNIYLEAKRSLDRAAEMGYARRNTELEQHLNEQQAALQTASAEATRTEEGRPVYFIGSDTGPIKIGVSHDPERRLSDLQRSSPAPLRIMATCTGGQPQEAEYHRRFKHLRQYGEWFERHPDILAEVDRLAAESVGPQDAQQRVYSYMARAY